MRAEGDPFFGDLAHLTEAEYLEAAAVGKDGLLPVHELVKASGFLDQIVAGTEEQVIGIAENDLRAHIVELFRRQRLDGRLRTDRHEHRCLERTVRSTQDSGTGAVAFGLLFVGNNHKFPP